MEIISKELDEEILVQINGKLDIFNAPVFHDAIQKIEPGDKKIVLDFKAVSYITSACLRELLILKKRFDDDQWELINVNNAVEEVFKSSGFSKFLNYSNLAEEDNYRNLSFKGILESKNRTCPDKEIFMTPLHNYTWKDMDIASHIVAKDLVKMGVEDGDHVALCGANTINWLITFFAIQKIGAVALLMNYGSTPEEVIKLANAGDIKYMCYGEMPAVGAIGPEKFTAAITADDSPIKDAYSFSIAKNYLDRADEFEPISKAFRVAYDSDKPSLMLFTSGSTGVPKGVLLSAYNMMPGAKAVADTTKLDADSASIQVLPLFHVFGMLNFLLIACYNDAPLVFPTSIKTSDLLELTQSMQAKFFASVPTLLLAMIANKDFKPEMVDSVTTVVLAGSAISAEQIKILSANFKNAQFFNAYGLSEIAPVSMTLHNETENHLTQTIGKPVEGIEVKIADPVTGEELPLGEDGEIVVRGTMLMTCYYNVPVDQQSIDENGYLHTGDLGHLDEDGYIYFTGRCKELIIRGGENIMPNEVAAAITKHPSIADVKVVGAPDDFYGEIVTVAIVLSEGHDFDEDKMREFLSDKLAKFKIPAHFFVYEKLPMLANGKVDAVSLQKEVAKKIKENK